MTEHDGAGIVAPGGKSTALNYTIYVATRALSTLAIQMMNLVVSWTLYDVSGNPLYLGLAGLVLFVPSLILILVVGMAADRFERQKIVGLAFFILAIAASAMTWLALIGMLEPNWILAILVLVGTARAFMTPTIKALLVNLVDRAELPRAIALNSTLNKVAVVSGPIAGGFLYAVSPALALGVAAGLLLIGLVLALSLRVTTQVKASSKVEVGDLMGGFKAIWNDKAMLGAIALDLFVVFIGGATALLPIFAKDVLGTDAIGLGVLRAAPALGAFLMAGLLTWRPIPANAGRTMLACVAGYGLSMLIFGLSSVYWLSFAALLVGGILDMVSVNVRESMVQLRTPDHMRGRVTAVNSVFVGASNELGDFRAGSFAAVVGAVPAVVVGGITALGIAAIWYKLFPEMAKVDKLV